MALRSPYRYVAEASDTEGRRLGELALTPDLEPAAQWSHLQGVRAGALPAHAHYGPGVVEPVYDERRGRPYVEGIRVRFDAGPSNGPVPVIPWSYFQQSVERSATRLVDDGKLEAGERFVYRICAFPDGTDHILASTSRTIVDDEAPAPLALEPGDIDSLVARAARLCKAAWHDADFPVFVHASLLDEATQMARDAGDRETGGILVGHLRRDTSKPEIYAEVTAQIPAKHARPGYARLSFTPETWSAVSDALALRKRNEIWIGWWHSHPFFCSRCDVERRRVCALSSPFFSRDDCELHRAIFDTAFSVALLLSDTGRDQLDYALFGWRNGMIAARGCYLLSRAANLTEALHVDGGGAAAARVLAVRERP